MNINSDDIGGIRYTSASKGEDGFTDSVAWSAQTEVNASDIVEKQRLVK